MDSSYADVSTANPHIKTLKDWPIGVKNTCTPCHGDPASTSPDVISSNCVSRCHTLEASEVASSRHSGLKCVYCHSVVHVGDKDVEGCNGKCHGIDITRRMHRDRNFASVWMLQAGVGEVMSFKEELYSYTELELQLKLGLNQSENRKIYMAYLDSDGESTGTNATRYLICLRCHLATMRPEESGRLTTVAQGVVKIGILKTDMEFIGHKVESVVKNERLVERSFTLNQILPPIIAVIVVTMIILTLIRRRFR